MSKTTRSYRWQMLPIPPNSVVRELGSSMQIQPHLARMLARRGVTDFATAKEFFNPSLEQLHNPFLMEDMDKAVGRLALAIQRNEQILIYGDYDVDGTTSVALMCIFLRRIGAQFEYYIPDRYKEGYGISFEGVQYAIDEGFELMVALDCGIKANDKVAYAQENDVDVIICDHHTPGEELPSAYAILDPKKSSCNYPFKELSGCGIGFKLLQGLIDRIGMDEIELHKLTDLAAISSACDIVPLTGENRVLVNKGLKQIASFPRPGIAKILGDKVNKELSVSDLVFGIGPKINAAGRIDHGSNAVELLIEEDDLQAEVMAKLIQESNEYRRDLDQQITAEALAQVPLHDPQGNTKSSVLYDPEWHKGVIGIVASRVIEQFYKPTVVFTRNGDYAAGSARSVRGFDVYEALNDCADCLIQFGGHKYAAGMTIELDQIDAFRRRFDAAVSKRIHSEQLVPMIEIDEELSFDQINRRFLNTLKRMAPFGPKNMKPNFVSRNVRDTGRSRIVGNDQTHLKIDFEQNGITHGGIAFGMADLLPLLQSKESVDVVYTLEENVWNGQVSIQLAVKDIQPSSDKQQPFYH